LIPSPISLLASSAKGSRENRCRLCQSLPNG
jgi:hypothetical protein